MDNKPTPPNDYYNSILQLCGDAFVNAGTGWSYSDNGTYVNSTTTIDRKKIRTIEVHHTTSNLYVRFWVIYPYGVHSSTQSYYYNFTNTDSSNQSSEGTSSYNIKFNTSNLLESDTSTTNYFRMPLNLFFAVANHTMDIDFGSNINSFTKLLPLDTCVTTQSNSTVNYDQLFSIAYDSTSSSMYPGGYSKTFWTVTDDFGNYVTLGFGHTESPRTYDRIHCFGNLLNNLDSLDQYNSFALYDRYTSGNAYSTLGRAGVAPPNAGGLSFYSKFMCAFSKNGTLYNNERTKFVGINDSLIKIDPRQFKFGNQINYTPLRVYLQSNDTNDPLVANGQSNKGFVSTDYIRYIGTDYPGTSANLWRTFDNKNWMLLTPGYLFRWDPTAPDMRNF